MGKILLKVVSILLTILIGGIILQNFYWGRILLIGILVAVSLVLILLLLALKELKAFQRPQPSSARTAGKTASAPYLKINYNNIDVSFLWNLNGGGILLAHEFNRIVSEKIGKTNHVFEYCAGPGFIGFSLLANNLCDKLTLADVNPAAVKAVEETIRNNKLQGRVKVYQSDCLDSIPHNERWDLVVGNPPWDIHIKRNIDIKVSDPQSRVHEKFYRDIKKFLKPDGTILFVEGAEYAKRESFNEMIAKNGLQLTAILKTASLRNIFQRSHYKNISFAMAVFLQLALFFREVYFIQAKIKNS